jgi:DNA-binding IclR family transcriptional regulator
MMASLPTFLALVSGHDYLCVDALQSSNPLNLAVRPGERKSLLDDALGHVLLAADDDLAQSVRSDDPQDGSATWPGSRVPHGSGTHSILDRHTGSRRHAW